jgi:hypothetical protein
LVDALTGFSHSRKSDNPGKRKDSGGGNKVNDNLNVIWRRGDTEMPQRAKHVVEAAQDELLLKSLQLPHTIVDLIRFNADKNARTIIDYISDIVVEYFKVAQ